LVHFIPKIIKKGLLNSKASAKELEKQHQSLFQITTFGTYFSSLFQRTTFETKNTLKVIPKVAL
jgi:hypothetical protein